jgi:hypothetical protein
MGSLARGLTDYSFVIAFMSTSIASETFNVRISWRLCKWNQLVPKGTVVIVTDF